MGCGDLGGRLVGGRFGWRPLEVRSLKANDPPHLAREETRKVHRRTKTLVFYRDYIKRTKVRIAPAVASVETAALLRLLAAAEARSS
jgi:hypothetical protein